MGEWSDLEGWDGVTVRPGRRMTCSVETCVRDADHLGLCNAHYLRRKRTGDVQAHLPVRDGGRTAGERFWEKVDRSGPVPKHRQDLGPCWLWTGHVHRLHGYGRFCSGGRGNTVNAHRFAYELTHGPVPVGLFVLHQCDNRKCVNPAHLRAGTHRENMDEMIARDRPRGRFARQHPDHGGDAAAFADVQAAREASA